MGQLVPSNYAGDDRFCGAIASKNDDSLGSPTAPLQTLLTASL